MKIKQNSSNDSNENLNINNEISKINTNFEFSEISAEFSRFSDEDSSFFFQTKPKKQLQPEIKYIEDSPNKKYSRSSKISYSEKYRISLFLLH